MKRACCCCEYFERLWTRSRSWERERERERDCEGCEKNERVYIVRNTDEDY